MGFTNLKTLLLRSGSDIERLSDMPPSKTRSDGEWQSDQNAIARDEFIRRSSGMLSSQQVTDVLGSAKPLQESSLLLCVRLQSQDAYPGFQFDTDNHRVYPEIQRLLKILSPDYEPGWQTALWFTSLRVKHRGSAR